MKTKRTKRFIDIETPAPNKVRYAHVDPGCIAYSAKGTINLRDMGSGCYIGGTVHGRSRICSGKGTINLRDMGIGCYIGGTVRGRSRICSEKAMAKR